MPMDQSYSLRCTEEGHQAATGWQSPLGPIDKQTVNKGQVVAQARALGLVSASSMHKWPRAR